MQVKDNVVSIPLRFLYHNFCRYYDRNKRSVTVQQIGEHLRSQELVEEVGVELDIEHTDVPTLILLNHVDDLLIP